MRSHGSWLDTIQIFFVQVGHETTYAAIIFTIPCHIIYVLALQRSLIILVGLTMTWYIEKMMISYSGIVCGFMPNLRKKY